MRIYPYKEAQALINSICKAAADGEYDTREKFLAMLEANPDVAAQGYNSFGKVFFWNQRSSHLYGYKESEAVNRDIYELILPPEMRPLARDLIDAAGRTGKMLEASSCDLLHRNGDYVTVFSGHVMFIWDSPSTPEFYCLDVGIDPERT
jgi:PAS domain-containing protein